MLSTISDTVTIASFLMNLWEKHKENKEASSLKDLAEEVALLKDKLITKQEVLELSRAYHLSESISTHVFGEHLSENSGNLLLQTISDNSGKLGYNCTIDPKEVKFSQHDLVFSSFGTPGYINYQPDGKGVVVYHAGGEDRDRIFCVQWGIGYYYRFVMNGSSSFLGFPVSDEHKTNLQGRSGSKSTFEGGYIEYVPEHNRLHIFRSGVHGSRLVAIHNF